MWAGAASVAQPMQLLTCPAAASYRGAKLDPTYLRKSRGGPPNHQMACSLRFAISSESEPLSASERWKSTGAQSLITSSKEEHALPSNKLERSASKPNLALYTASATEFMKSELGSFKTDIHPRSNMRP